MYWLQGGKNLNMIKMGKNESEKENEKRTNDMGPNDTGKVNEPEGVYQSGEPLSFEKVWQMFQEMGKKSMETERILKEQSMETERILKEQLSETARLIAELREEYKNRWGELIESLVSGSLLRMLADRGIAVSKTRKHVMQYKGEPNYEFDIVASNGEEVVVVEVKSTLNPGAVKHFIGQLQLARKTSRRFRKQRIIGAVAYLSDHCDASTMAMKRGLLVIRATGDSAVIINEEGFEPVRF